MPHALYIVADNNAQTLADSLAQYLSEECGLKLLPYMAREIKDYLDQGFTDSLLEQLIDATARAPRPSWAYFAACVYRCKRFDVHTTQEHFMKSSQMKSLNRPERRDDLPF